MSMQISVDGMSCASCVARVDRAVSAVPGVSGVAVNLASETVRFDGPVGSVVEALAAAGYPARVAVLNAPVEGMSCAGCAGRVQRGLAAVPGVISVPVRAASGLTSFICS